MEMSNLVAKLKSLNLELGEDLIVHLVLISLPTHFGMTNDLLVNLYLIVCKRKRGCREIRLKNKKMKNIKGTASHSLDVFMSFKVEVELYLERKLKSSNLIVVVNTMVDMIDENNVQNILPFFSKSVELFRNTQCQANLA
ncbi:hypothetical protein CR513_40779, partial [Mucuna pruriens]